MDSRTVRERPNVPRSPGVHVQAINKALGVAAGKLDSDEDSPFEKFSETCYPLMPALGVAWEEFRASTYSESELLWQPFELERDGIFGTPDGLWIAEPETAIWEAKLTSKKITSIADCYMYLKQGLAYCAMSGQTRVLFEVCWFAGNYNRPLIPLATASLVEFEEREIEAWWKVILAASKNVPPER